MLFLIASTTTHTKTTTISTTLVTTVTHDHPTGSHLTTKTEMKIVLPSRIKVVAKFVASTVTLLVGALSFSTISRHHKLICHNSAVHSCHGNLSLISPLFHNTTPTSGSLIVEPLITSQVISIISPSNNLTMVEIGFSLVMG